MRARPWTMRLAAASMAALFCAGTAVVVVPSGEAGATSEAKVGQNVPASAMSTKTGITSSTVNIANIAWTSIFGGAAVGTKAYADYLNSTGGVNGRKLVVTSQSTNYSGTTYARLTQAALTKDFAMVGGFSVTSTSGGKILAKNPGMPDVQVTVSPFNNKLTNLVSPFPLQGGWQEGSLLYFKNQNPKAAKQAAAMVADDPSAVSAWNGQEATMKHVGYTIVYENTFPETATYATFVSDAIAMKNKGVKILFIEQNPPLYAAPLIKALNAQNFHPMVVLGASTYSDTLIPTSGSVSATNGMYLEQDAALYLGTDAKAIPAVTTFLHWVKVATASAKPTLFTLYGWLSTELFAQGLKAAGKNPTRGSLLKALGKITAFNGTNLETTVNPAAKTVSNCYLIGRIKNGKWLRQTDPPVSSSTHGYRCTNQYYIPPGTPY
jgi:branched-chain amino acid transport system substrate-binding protein